MKISRTSNINAHRDSWVEVNINNIENNINELKKCVPADMKFLAVVKADSYGHGASMLAPTMLASGVDMFGVASIDEALNLRENGVNAEILVLGAVPVWALTTAVENDITVTIFSEEHLNSCKSAFKRINKPVKAHIKLDTGMNRIGVSPKNAVEFIKKIQAMEEIDLKGIFSHLANSENLEKTQEQLNIWENIISQINTDGLLLHILNTAGIISSNIFKCTSNMVRGGIGLYGLYPDLVPNAQKVNLKQAMSVKTRIIHIHEIEKGEGVCYGHTFVADKPTVIATVPLGYADGIPRLLSNKFFGHLNGQKVKQVGNVAMDQMMFDITGVNANVGDVITLLDESLPIDNWANIMGTIHYEIICHLKARLTRVYTR
ncbi:MAG: alanine racemase [Candidatus Gastranaerophilaceae bacterium]